MGSRITETLPIALGILDRCQATALVDVGAGTTQSSYSEANPRPGLGVIEDPYSYFRPVIRGGQQRDLDVRVVRSGNPGRSTGAQLVYKRNSEAASLWRGWDGPQLPGEWVPLDFYAGTPTTAHDIATVPRTQDAVVALYDSAGAVCTLYSIDDTLTRTAGGSTLAAGADWNYPTLWVDHDSSRVFVLFGGSVYYTDDSGGNWQTVASVATSEDTSTYGRTRAAKWRDTVVLLVEDTTTANKCYQLSSTNGGTSFTLVKEYTSFGSDLSVCASAAGFHVVYRDASGNAQYRALQSAGEELDARDPTQVGASIAADGLWICADSSDMLWVGAGSSQFIEQLTYSDDLGVTWLDPNYTANYRINTGATTSKYRAATWAGGRLLVVQTIDGTTGTGWYSAVRCHGGWASASLYNASGTKEIGDQLGWTSHEVSAVVVGSGYVYYPTELPTQQGWTLSGTAGTVNTSTFELDFAALGSYGQTFTSSKWQAVDIQGYRTAGGTTVTIARGVLADGTDDLEWYLRYNGNSTLEIYDVHAASVIATTSVDVTTTLRVRVAVDFAAETITAAYARSGASQWTVWANGTSLTSDTATPRAATACELNFGIVTITAASTIHIEHYHFAQSAATAAYSALSTSVATRLGRPSNVLGFPLHDEGSSTDAAMLALESGPGMQADAQTIPAFYENAVDNAWIDVSPSPRRYWRSTDTSEQTFVWELGDDSEWIGAAVGLVIRGANFRTAYIESYNGATWDTRATLDLAEGFTGLTYKLAGNLVYPDDTATADADRYLWQDEKAAGYVVLTSNKARKIVSHGAGGWSQTTSVIPYLSVEGIDGSESASGAAYIVSPGGVLVWYPTDEAHTRARYWRVRIPASQVVPDSYYQASTIALVRLAAAGKRTDWGSTTTYDRRVDRREDADGNDVYDQRAPMGRIWTFGWASGGVHLRRIRDNVAPDYIGASGGLPVTAYMDVEYTTRADIERLRSGEIPVVVVDELPSADTTLTDPARWLVGTLSSDLRSNNIQGDKGRDESDRIEPLAVKEIV